MKYPKLTLTAAFAISALAGAWGVQTLEAQQQAAFKRTILQTQDLSADGRQAVVALVEFQPGAVIGKHTHPGEEIGYILEGALVLEVDGKPPVTLKAGDAFFVEAGRVHWGRNGDTPGKALSTYVVEKGKPLATPVK